MDVFISHASADKDFANLLSAKLRKADLSVWQDEQEIKWGDDWVSKIADGITKSNYILLLLSKQSINSSWVKTEAALSVSESKKKVIPILLDQELVLPSYLASIQALNISQSEDVNSAIDQLIEIIKAEPRESLNDQIKAESKLRLLEAKKWALEHERTHLKLETEAKYKDYTIKFSYWIILSCCLSGVALIFLSTWSNSKESNYFLNLIYVILGFGFGLVGSSSYEKLINRIANIIGFKKEAKK